MYSNPWVNTWVNSIKVGKAGAEQEPIKETKRTNGAGDGSTGGIIKIEVYKKSSSFYPYPSNHMSSGCKWLEAAFAYITMQAAIKDRSLNKQSAALLPQPPSPL